MKKKERVMGCELSRYDIENFVFLLPVVVTVSRQRV